ncbi:GNAT family N-acetyltransferase [Mangrovimonas sp. TPBH4]|uniref:GNAT family N-acetyltransferase n=1 Tax=Mangrovimonas sp. TPBH4 TaxID=1645914 RepID=UPI0006B67CD0|nr:GNAT family N-acetyltransferase [Mangrovimonas sp. TPBH4]
MTKKAFTPFPVLTTKRLTLRQVLISDVNAVFALRSDNEINKYLDRQPAKNLEDAKHFIANITENIQKGEALYWGITLTESGIFVGSICLFEFSDQHNTCEIGYELLKNHQGKGIMTEAANAVIAYAFQTLSVQTIEASTHKSNQASIKLLDKLHFKKATTQDPKDPDFLLYVLYKWE